MPASSNAHEEPNLVPLLDLVLQLVMFFMICANFAMKQVDTTILLPVAQSAKPAPTKEENSDIVYLNVTESGGLLVLGKPEPLTGDADVTGYLQTIADSAKRRNPKDPALPTLVIVRAHRDAEYADVYRILRKCQEVGLRKLQLRTRLGERSRS